MTVDCVRRKQGERKKGERKKGERKKERKKENDVLLHAIKKGLLF